MERSSLQIVRKDKRVFTVIDFSSLGWHGTEVVVAIPIVVADSLTAYLSRMYETTSEPLAPLPVFYKRLFRNFIYVAIILSICLGIGVFGYHYTEHVRWIDALHNASMILSGMGPVIELKTTTGKLFSSAYAIFSGVAFITNISFLLAPAAHRFFHHLHLEE